MKVSTKIILGYALLILLLVLTLVYELTLVHRMQTINQDLARMKTRETVYSLRSRDIEQVIDFIKRLYITKDPDYAAQVRDLFKQMRLDLEQDIAELKSDTKSRKEKKEVQRFAALWSDFENDEKKWEEWFPALSTTEFDAWLANHTEALETQMGRILSANRAAIDTEVHQSAVAGKRAEFVSKVAAGIAVLLSFVVSFVVVRSISHSLKQLTSGARAVAQGEFSYRLDASGTDNFSQVARDFNFMVSKLDEREQLKRDYVSHVSHELKAPLAAMQETARLLMEGIPGPVNERQKRLLNLTLESGQRLSRTIASLLDLSRLEANAVDYDIERTDLREVIRSASSAFEVQINQDGRNLDLQLPSEPLYVDCDSDRIGQIISNLIDNALKFAPNSTPIAIRAQQLNGLPENLPAAWRARFPINDASFALIQVEDRGRGVPDEHKELIFEKFHQVKFEKKIAGQGVGLGLVICKNIVEAHRGAIWVDDNPGGGSIFFVLLPAYRTEAKPFPLTPIGRTPAAEDVQPARM
ncbi:MAG TPA: HAMP domain-containing sensor histidine kinase [Acidobacteriota bacterium]|nr:HAMP domain-containing sensor histidine kinase [Acidobacteriota bacterium]